MLHRAPRKGKTPNDCQNGPQNPNKDPNRKPNGKNVLKN